MTERGPAIVQSASAGTGTAAQHLLGAGDPPVSAQLASAITQGARQPDGSYEVNIRLQPEELGAVHVQLHLDAGTVNVQLNADGGATRDLLRQNLGQLRQQLADSGLATGRFDVGGGNGAFSQGQPYRHSQAAAPQPGGNRDQGTMSPVIAAGRVTAASITNVINGQLDVRL